LDWKSGLLNYMANEPKVIIKEDGPYLVYGRVPLLEEHSEDEYPIQDVVALCRCGHSKDKPFCDGSHLREGRKAE